MKEIQASEENRKGQKTENSHILVEMNFAMQMKVANCSLDQNPTLIWSSLKKSEACIVSKMAVCVKVTHRPVAPPCAPMKKFIKWKKSLLPSSIRSQSFKSISELKKKLCLFEKVPFLALFCVVFGFFHLQGRGDPSDPKYYNKYCSPRGQELCTKVSEKPWKSSLAPSHTMPLYFNVWGISWASFWQICNPQLHHFM